MFVPVIYKLEVSRKVDAGVRSIESAEGERLGKEKKPEVKVTDETCKAQELNQGRFP
jgi:hypothetical protein